MFQELGFYKEYWVKNKFIGIINCEKDREVVGYAGRKTETLTEPITLKNKKTLKLGTEVTTLLYPLCGRIK